jgi:hypothetical protein
MIAMIAEKNEQMSQSFGSTTPSLKRGSGIPQ